MIKYLTIIDKIRYTNSPPIQTQSELSQPRETMRQVQTVRGPSFPAGQTITSASHGFNPKVPSQDGNMNPGRWQNNQDVNNSMQVDDKNTGNQRERYSTANIPTDNAITAGSMSVKI